jgi:hypothetical protein
MPRVLFLTISTPQHFTPWILEAMSRTTKIYFRDDGISRTTAAAAAASSSSSAFYRVSPSTSISPATSYSSKCSKCFNHTTIDAVPKFSKAANLFETMMWMLVHWETIKENIKISAKQSLGYYEMKKHNPWFNEAYLRLRHLGQFLMEQSDDYDAPINKVLQFIRSVGLIEG